MKKIKIVSFLPHVTSLLVTDCLVFIHPMEKITKHSPALSVINTSKCLKWLVNKVYSFLCQYYLMKVSVLSLLILQCSEGSLCVYIYSFHSDVIACMYLHNVSVTMYLCHCIMRPVNVSFLRCSLVSVAVSYNGFTSKKSLFMLATLI